MFRHFLALAVATTLLPAQAATVSTRSTLGRALDGLVVAADGNVYVSTAEGRLYRPGSRGWQSQ